MTKYKIYKYIIDTCVFLYYCYELYNHEIKNMPYIMFFHNILDIPFNTTSLKIHHVINAVYASTYIFDIKTNSRKELLYTFLKCEYCTLFLSMKKLTGYISKNLVLKQFFERTFEICFFISFVYYRLYKTFNILLDMDSIYKDVGFIYHGGIYIIYILNLYRFTKMIKKICNISEEYIKIRTRDTINIFQYIYFIIPIYNIISIKKITPIIALLDSMAVSIYCFFSHMYISNYYKSLIKKKKVNPHLYLYEKISIHLRSYIGICIVLSCKKISIDFIIIIISWISHSYMINNFIIDYYKEFHLEPHILKHEKMLYKLPIFFDNLCLYLLSNHYEKLVVYTFLFCMIFIMYIKPFGKNNHHELMYQFITNFMITRGINHP